MNNQKNKNSKIDLSKFPFEKEKKPSLVFPKPRLGGFRISWSRMDRKTRIYTIIIGIVILITVPLISLSFKPGGKGKEIIPSSQYTPPTGEEWEEYTPPFP